MPPAAPVTTQTLSLTFISTSSGALERLDALDGHPVAQPLVRKVIPHRMMHCRAVVPEGDRVGLPHEAALEFRRLAMPVEHLEQGIALGLAQTDDRGRE